MAAAALEEVPPIVEGDGWPYRFEVLPLNELFVDEDYQRPLTNFVNRIKKRFDPALVGTLVVSRRKKPVKVGGKSRFYAIVDGQTRWVAMTDLDFLVVPCVVFHDLTQGAEADLFGRLQRERRGVMSYHRFRADLVAGKPEATAINKIVEAVGYETGPHGRERNTVSAVAALEAVYRRSPEVLEQALSVFREAWGDRWLIEGSHLRAMGHFLHRNAPELPGFDEERLARRLSIVSPEELKRRASQLREGRGATGPSSDGYMAEAIEGIYRRGKEK